MLFGAFVNISVPVCVYIGWWRHRIHGHDMIAILWVWNVVMSGAKIYHVIRIKLRHCHVYGQRETDWWLFCDAPSVFSRERSTNDSVTVTVSGIHTCNYGGYQCSLNYICITSGLNVPNIPAYRWDIHRLTATYFRCTSVIAGFRRHLVGKTLINVRYRDTDKLMII